MKREFSIAKTAKSVVSLYVYSLMQKIVVKSQIKFEIGGLRLEQKLLLNRLF